jgi:multidrug efflux pump subunit AcrA (membrane-fusion protein)
LAGLPKDKLIKFGAIGGGALLLAVLMFPVGQTRYLQGEIAPISLGNITSPATGKVSTLAVSEGQVVQVDQLLGTVTPDGLESTQKLLEQKLAQLDSKHSELTRSVKPVMVAKAKMALSPKQRELDLAQKDFKKLQDLASAAKPGAPKARADRAVKLGQLAVAKKQAAVDAATKALDAVTMESKLKANVDEAAQVTEQLAALKKSPGVEVHAPSAGRLRGLPPLSARVEKGAEFGRLVAPAELRVTVKDPPLPAGTDVKGATLSAGKLTGIAIAAFKWETGTPPSLVGKLTQPPAEIAPGPTVVEVALKRRPFLLSLFGQ